MNRLQKKCVIATAGFHLLLLVILFVGPAFFNSKPKVDDSQVLDVIPANLIDAAFNSGVKNASPPAPAPIVTPPQPQPTPTPPAPKIVQPAPQPTIAERLEKLFTPTPVKPAPTENQPHKIQPSLTPVIRNTPKNATPTKLKDNSAAAKDLARSLKNKLSSATKIDMPGESNVAYAPYDSAVLSIYDQAWISPDDMTSSEAVVKVKVIISRDGTVISATIVDPSGDSKVDQSVQQALNHVTYVRPFPEGAKEDQRTIEFNFRSRAKSLNE